MIRERGSRKERRKKITQRHRDAQRKKEELNELIGLSNLRKSMARSPSLAELSQSLLARSEIGDVRTKFP